MCEENPPVYLLPLTRNEWKEALRALSYMRDHYLFDERRIQTCEALVEKLAALDGRQRTLD